MRKFLAFFISFCLSVTCFAQMPSTSNQQFADIQLNQNPGFENGKVRYINSGGTFATTSTNPFMGKVSATWQASSAGQYLKTALMPIPYGLQGNKCSASFAYTGGDSNVSVQVFDGSANPLSQPVTLSLRTAWTDPQAPVVLNFNCPSTSVYVQWTASAASATLYLDQVLVGSISRDRSRIRSSGNVIELLPNPGAENSSAVSGWTVSGGAASVIQPGTSGFMFGAGTFKWQASAISQTFQSGALPVYGLANGMCAAQMFYTYGGASGDYTLSISNGSSTLNTLALPQNPFALAPVTLTFSCGSASTSTLNFILTSNVASPAAIYFDNLHLGSLIAQPSSSAQPVTITRYLTAGTFTYNPPAGVTQIEVVETGGGAGGSGSGSGGGIGTAGGTTSFGTSLLVTTGGAPGAATGGNSPGAGGTATVSAPAIPIVALSGGAGAAAGSTAGGAYVGGGVGGTNPFGGSAGSNGSGGGAAAAANTGAGGPGGQSPAGSNGGSGGGAGGYIDALVTITSQTSFAVVIGTGGSGGAAGTSGFPGGAGGLGAVLIRETYGQIGNAFPSTNGGLSPGDEVATGASVCPIGTIPEDGSSYATTTYPQLFATIGYKYGGSGANFNVPNSQGMFDRGAGTQTDYAFTIPSSTIVAGSVYSNNSQTFTVLNAVTSGTSLLTSGTGAPLSTGTLTLVSGTGPSTIAYTASVAMVYSGTEGVVQTDQLQGHKHYEMDPAAGTFQNFNVSGSGGTTAMGGYGTVANGTFTTGSPITDGTDGAPRVGSETRPASVSHLKCIRTGYSSGANTVIGAVQSADNMNGITVVNSTQTYTSSATLTSAIETAFVDATSGPVTITLPPSSASKGKKFYITKIDSSANIVTIVRQGSDVIGSALSQTILVQQDETDGFTADGLGKWRWLTSQERITRVQVTVVCSASPCAILSQSGSSVTSVNRLGTGNYQAVFVTGLFSAAANCSGAGLNSTGTTTVSAGGFSAGAWSFYTTSGYTSPVDSAFNFNCVGPR